MVLKRPLVANSESLMRYRSNRLKSKQKRKWNTFHWDCCHSTLCDWFIDLWSCSLPATSPTEQRVSCRRRIRATCQKLVKSMKDSTPDSCKFCRHILLCVHCWPTDSPAVLSAQVCGGSWRHAPNGLGQRPHSGYAGSRSRNSQECDFVWSEVCQYPGWRPDSPCRPVLPGTNRVISICLI